MQAFFYGMSFGEILIIVVIVGIIAFVIGRRTRK